MLTDIQITLNPVMSVDVQARLGYVKDHSVLQNLDYEHSGHTGFASTAFVNTELAKKVDKVTGSSLVPDSKVSSYDSHLSSTTNPHNVTKSQVGLGSVANKSMDDAPTSGSANYVKSGGVYTELGKKVDKVTGSSLVPDSKVSSYDSHLTNKGNPHSVTKSQVGLGNCDNTSDINKPVSTAVQNALNNKADLVNGLIPASQLPSYVDDVVDFEKQVTGADFMAQILATVIGSMVWIAAAKSHTGDTYYRKFAINNDGTQAGLTLVEPESGKIYVGKTDTNCFRWTGSNLVEISKSLAIGETASTAYAGNKGKANADAIAAIRNGVTMNDFASVETAIHAIVNIYYPIGSVYISVNSTNPGTLFGGTWEQIQDRFLLACGVNHTAGSTGGSQDSVVVSHTHSFSGSTEYGGTHTHQGIKRKGLNGGSTTGVATTTVYSGSLEQDLDQTVLVTSGGYHNHSFSGTTNSNGESGIGKNMPPYLTVYMWKRIS